MTITTRLYTYFNGEVVGQDQFGTRYFREKRPKKGASERRWALFRAGRDPSIVSPEWHGWLHHTGDIPPNKTHRQHFGWEKPPIPNQTGGANAYLPPGAMQRGGKHAATIAEYEPWRP